MKLFLKKRDYFVPLREEELKNLVKKCVLYDYPTDRETCALCTILERIKNENSTGQWFSWQFIFYKKIFKWLKKRDVDLIIDLGTSSLLFQQGNSWKQKRKYIQFLETMMGKQKDFQIYLI